MDIIYSNNGEKHRHENYETPVIPEELQGISWEEFYKKTFFQKTEELAKCYQQLSDSNKALARAAVHKIICEEGN